MYIYSYDFNNKKLKNVYCVRSNAYDQTAAYSHYYDIAMYSNRKSAEAHKALLEKQYPGEKFWISTEALFTKMPIIALKEVEEPF